MNLFEIIAVCAKFVASIFSAIFNFITEMPTPPTIDLEKIDFITDTDRIVVGLLIVLHVLYVFLLSQCLDWDRTDNFMHKKAIQINDAPFGVYKYLIRIYTNWRPRSGTKSKIFIQLHGNLCQNTICYFLHNPFLPYRQLFVWGDCSFFVINTANPVGEIQALTIGHDDSADSWFLSKVLVKDLQMNKEYRFFAHCWLLRDEKNFAELRSYVTLKPVDPSYVEPFGERVFQWVRRCYRERPLMSFFYLNLLTPQSRVTRLNITYFYIILSMLVNMMYFNESKGGDLRFIVWTSSIKSFSSYLLLLILQSAFDIECFTALYPTKRQFNIRVAVYLIFFALYSVQIGFLLVYSTAYHNNRRVTINWLVGFLTGLIQSEFLFSLIAAFSKAILYTFFSKDPFTEEGEQIIMTYRNKLFSKTACR